jgi:hypothetical protein
MDLHPRFFHCPIRFLGRKPDPPYADAPFRAGFSLPGFAGVGPT